MLVYLFLKFLDQSMGFHEVFHLLYHVGNNAMEKQMHSAIQMSIEWNITVPELVSLDDAIQPFYVESSISNLTILLWLTRSH